MGGVVKLNNCWMLRVLLLMIKSQQILKLRKLRKMLHIRISTSSIIEAGKEIQAVYLSYYLSGKCTQSGQALVPTTLCINHTLERGANWVVICPLGKQACFKQCPISLFVLMSCKTSQFTVLKSNTLQYINCFLIYGILYKMNFFFKFYIVISISFSKFRRTTLLGWM